MNKPAALGIDVGGTKTLCVLVNKHCETLESIKFKTDAHDGSKQFNKHLIQAAKALTKIAREKKLQLTGIGVGWAGSIDHKRGRIKSSPNLLSLEDFPITSRLKSALKTEITLGNDVQLGL